MSGSKKGFSAIEIIVVVGILVILGGIVWYTLGNKAGADSTTSRVTLTSVTPGVTGFNKPILLNGKISGKIPNPSKGSVYVDLYKNTNDSGEYISFDGYYRFQVSKITKKGAEFQVYPTAKYCKLDGSYPPVNCVEKAVEPMTYTLALESYDGKTYKIISNKLNDSLTISK